MADQPRPPEFLLRFRTDKDAVPCVIRLRRLLKALLRIYGFRVIDVREAAQTAPASQEPAGANVASATGISTEVPETRP
jgi:hypothetical protein